tara:strand:+ start:223 stop:786 length:564 start_codon:yes stop_codon:yes gene_type:complete
MNCNKDLCYKTSNNKHFGCPPRMDDGRHFTDYRGNCYVNNLVRNNNNIYNSFQYRQYLTHNANKLMDLNRANSCEKNCCGPCQQPYEVGTMLPEKNKSVCGDKACGVGINSPDGLGLGRAYSDAPLSCNNWPASLPVNQPTNCCTPPENNFSYYPIDKTITVPSGGKRWEGGSLDNPLTGGDPRVYS